MRYATAWRGLASSRSWSPARTGNAGGHAAEGTAGPDGGFAIGGRPAEGFEAAAVMDDEQRYSAPRRTARR